MNKWCLLLYIFKFLKQRPDVWADMQANFYSHHWNDPIPPGEWIVRESLHERIHAFEQLGF